MEVFCSIDMVKTWKRQKGTRKTNAGNLLFLTFTTTMNMNSKRTKNYSTSLFFFFPVYYVEWDSELLYLIYLSLSTYLFSQKIYNNENKHKIPLTICYNLTNVYSPIKIQLKCFHSNVPWPDPDPLAGLIATRTST